MLDENGGTDVFPVAPAKLKITQGSEVLKSVRFTDRGMFRWYAGCCNTPIGNSMASHKFPFTGVIHTIMDHKSTGKSRDQALGPIASRCQSKCGIGTLPADARQMPALGFILKTVKFLLVGLIQGHARPSPFFDAEGKPRVSPYILNKLEREGLRKFCGPNPER